MQLLENTATYVHAGVAVDYGGFLGVYAFAILQLHSRIRQVNHWELGLQDVVF